MARGELTQLLQVTSGQITSFKDPALRDSKFILEVLESLKPGTVDWDLLRESDYLTRAQYAVSKTRTFIGVRVYLLPQDIKEVVP